MCGKDSIRYCAPTITLKEALPQVATPDLFVGRDADANKITGASDKPTRYGIPCHLCTISRVTEQEFIGTTPICNTGQP